MVGNGEQLVIWHDKWLSQCATSRIFSLIRVLDENTKVKELILAGINCWNERLIKEIFDKDVVAQICSIPLSMRGGEDRAVWGYTEDGSYIVRSAYYLEKHRIEEGAGESSRRQMVNQMWKRGYGSSMSQKR